MYIFFQIFHIIISNDLLASLLKRLLEFVKKYSRTIFVCGKANADKHKIDFHKIISLFLYFFIISKINLAFSSLDNS